MSNCLDAVTIGHVARTSKNRRKHPGGRPRLIADRARVTFDLERADFEELRQLAGERGLNVSALLREVVGRFVQRARRGR